MPVWLQTGQIDGSSPLLLTSPHSGHYFPDDFRRSTDLSVSLLRRLEDAHVGQLLQRATAHGVPLLEATHGRAVIDLNRAVDDHDPAMLEGPLPITARPTMRTTNGYGLFPKITRPGHIIHRSAIPVVTALSRIRTLHSSWHQAIATALQAARLRHGFAILLDVHSMPRLKGKAPAAIVLGDRHGSSAAASLIDWLQAAFETRGLLVARNAPYAGGFMTSHHGQPAQAIHAIQIEIDRSLYMDPHSLVPHGGFSHLSMLLADIISQLQQSLPLMGLLPDLAAE